MSGGEKMKKKVMKIAMSAYAEYRKHTPDATRWEGLTTDQQEGFAAGIFHGLVILEMIPDKIKFALGR